ncbi:hypothetical protein OAN59_03205 [Alphaproteobacteria bacterium]|nr:hypothetical protein [Alphaproteobacteria bacterium]
MNLNTIMDYGEKLERDGKSSLSIYGLIVVGRGDTGDLEAQIRGSKHAWNMRLISIEALSRLLFLKTELEDETFSYKVNQILKPIEYTRVDEIIGILFDTHHAMEKINIAEVNDEDIAPDSDEHDISSKRNDDRKEIALLKNKIIHVFSGNREQNYKKEKGSAFIDEFNKTYVTCSISKRHPIKRSYPYWYALRRKHLRRMREVGTGYFIFGFMDREEAYAIPLNIIEENLDYLRFTDNGEKDFYWHIDLIPMSNGMVMRLSSRDDNLNIDNFSFKLV